jgi:hypothetical protein
LQPIVGRLRFLLSFAALRIPIDISDSELIFSLNLLLTQTPCAMDNVKTKKLTTLISKLTIAANKAVAKKTVEAQDPRKQFSITGLNVHANYDHRRGFAHANLLRTLNG